MQRSASHHEGPQRVGSPGGEPEAARGRLRHRRFHSPTAPRSAGLNDKEVAAAPPRSPPPRIASRAISTRRPAWPSPTRTPRRRTPNCCQAGQRREIAHRRRQAGRQRREMRRSSPRWADSEAFVDAHSLSATTNWQAVQTSLGKLQQAFGLPPVGMLTTMIETDRRPC